MRVSEFIEWEGTTLLSSLFWGMLLSLEYDCIRILRRIVIHRKVWIMSVEDIIFWLNAAITVFCVTYEVNNGIIRGFSLIGFVVGALIYRYSFGRIYVKYVAMGILFILKPLKKLINYIKINVHAHKKEKRSDADNENRKQKRT